MSPTILTDLRSMFGQARDQSARPTCLAFAASDTHAALRSPWSPLSCEFAFYHAQRRAGRPPTGGALLGSMLTTLKENGQPIEADWPYLASLPMKLDDYGPPDGLTVYRRSGCPQAGGIDEIVATMDGGAPALVLMMLSDAFYVPNADGVVIAPPGERPDPVRRHAVIAVAHGSRGVERMILVRNSWGAAWGLAGHAWLSESYLTPRITRVALLKGEVHVPDQTLAA